MALLHLSILSIFLLTTIQIHGYPSGAPKKACTSSMLPQHKHYTPQPPSTSPITKFNTTWNPDGETIAGKKSGFILRSNPFSCDVFLVNIESNKPIKGIFVQGRLVNGTEPLGTFVDIPSETHLVHCPSVCETKILFLLIRMMGFCFRAMV